MTSHLLCIAYHPTPCRYRASLYQYWTVVRVIAGLILCAITVSYSRSVPDIAEGARRVIAGSYQCDSLFHLFLCLPIRTLGDV
eukprot:1789887-Rhodomonas_salina.1